MTPALKPNREAYVESLRRLGPDGRLRVAIELTEATQRMLRDAIATRHPELPEAERHRIYLERLRQCRNRNY
jgi:hypothetical protein